MRDLFTSFKDNCGFGLLASIDNTPSRRNLEDAVTSLSRMMHRGAVAADGKTGDGSGLLLSIPKKFFRKEAKKEGITLPDVYAVAMVFSKNEKDLDIIKEVVPWIVIGESEDVLNESGEVDNQKLDNMTIKLS